MTVAKAHEPSVSNLTLTQRSSGTCLCSEIRRVRLSSSNVQNSHFEACHVDFGARSRGDVLSALVSAATIAFQDTACAFLRERPTRERAADR